jgi:ElaB/YqjD/DUF883 family membrane-anchored ribosome-binding protein
MENSSSESSSSKTASDVDKLKKTASEAAGDLGETASKHASRAKEQVKDLVADAKEEGQQQLEKAKGSLDGLVAAGREYFQQRPVLCLAIAFALGAFWARERCRKD